MHHRLATSNGLTVLLCSRLLGGGGGGKIVVTGIGSVSPLGEGAEFWDGLVAGRSGIVTLPSWADEYPAKVNQLTQFQ